MPLIPRLARRIGIELHDVQILRRPAGHAAARPLPAGVRIVELGVDDTATICANARRHGQVRSEQRMAARFGHGLRHFMLVQDAQAIAWTWLAAGVPRYVDELCWLIPMAPRQAWVRDAFVAPAQRGRRLLAVMLDATEAHLGGGIEYFSDVEAGNVPSLRAHAATGFVPCARVRAAATAKWCLRPTPPASLPPVQAIHPSRRLLWLDADVRRWHLGRIA